MLLGALGPVMTRTAAEVADGLLVMPFHSHRHFRERTLPAVDGGAGPARRTRAPFAVYPQAIVAMGRTAERARAAARLGVRGLLAFYGSTPAYRPVLDVEGWGDLQPELNALSKTGDYPAMFELVDRRRWSTRSRSAAPPRSARPSCTRRFGDLADRVCCLLPGVRRAARRHRQPWRAALL